MYSDTKNLLLPEIKPTKAKPRKSKRRRGQLAFIADAIRRGIKQYPNWLQGISVDDDNRGACAWGAAVAGGVTRGQVRGLFVISPCTREYGPVPNVIVHLNDTYSWNRGRIARWLDYAKVAKQ